METRVHIDEQRAIDMYVKERKGVPKIAEELQVSTTRINRTLKEHNIKKRSSSEARTLDVDVELAKKAFERGYTIREIAKEFGVSRETIKRRLGIRKD